MMGNERTVEHERNIARLVASSDQLEMGLLKHFETWDEIEEMVCKALMSYGLGKLIMLQQKREAAVT
jgi:hypothetical protein